MKDYHTKSFKQFRTLQNKRKREAEANKKGKVIPQTDKKPEVNPQPRLV